MADELLECRQSTFSGGIMIKEKRVESVRKATKKKTGFTLIEVLVSILIMAIGLSAIGVSVVTALRISSQSKERSKVLAFARMQLEELHTVGFDNAAMSVGKHNFPSTAPYKGFYRVYNTSASKRRIYLRVFWDEAFYPIKRNAHKHRVEIHSTISNALH